MTRGWVVVPALMLTTGTSLLFVVWVAWLHRVDSGTLPWWGHVLTGCLTAAGLGLVVTGTMWLTWGTR